MDLRYTMAANTNKRIPVKHIRDRAKSKYPKKVKCHICSTHDNLELHHYVALTNLLEKWQKETGIILETDEQVLAVRDEFIAEHEYELFEAVVVLCAQHHSDLHSVYGKSPLLSSALKQEAWVATQREKYTNEPETVKPHVVVPKQRREAKPRPANDLPIGGSFSKFYSQHNGFAKFRTP